MVDLSVLGWWLDSVIPEVFSSHNEAVTLHSEHQVCPDSSPWGQQGAWPAWLLCSTQAVRLCFSGVPAAAAAAHVAGSLPAAGAGQPARVPAAHGPAPAAALPGAGLAGARQQRPAEAPADLHRAAAPARGPFAGNQRLPANNERDLQVSCAYCDPMPV